MKDFDTYDLYAGGKSASKNGFKRCYHSHPPLKVGDFTVYGGNCGTPIVEDADIYIGFDHSMNFSTGHWPWARKTEEVFFPIQDMNVPKSFEDFDALIKWVCTQLQAGKKVHAGCIGGHGRTGMFLAALVTVMTGEKDSIAYVRKHYCEKAVETDGQIKWLGKHYGIAPVKPSKGHGTHWGQSSSYGSKAKTSPRTAQLDVDYPNPFPPAKPSPNLDTPSPHRKKRVITPVASPKSMWLEAGAVKF